jgi:hypothetical protein
VYVCVYVCVCVCACVYVPDSAVVHRAKVVAIDGVYDSRVDEIHAVSQARDDCEGPALEERAEDAAFACFYVCVCVCV